MSAKCLRVKVRKACGALIKIVALLCSTSQVGRYGGWNSSGKVWIAHPTAQNHVARRYVSNRSPNFS